MSVGRRMVGLCRRVVGGYSGGMVSSRGVVRYRGRGVVSCRSRGVVRRRGRGMVSHRGRGMVSCRGRGAICRGMSLVVDEGLGLDGRGLVGLVGEAVAVAHAGEGATVAVARVEERLAVGHNNGADKQEGLQHENNG